jgi:CheY-like chemotaxis protein
MNNILVIDDNTHILEAHALRIGMWLQDWNILTAKNGSEGTEIMASLPVSLVLTDLQMPVMDGYGVIEFRNRNHPLLPLIAMTGNFTPEVREKLQALHVSECIEKPFDFDNLVGRIVGALGVHSHADAMLAHAVFHKLPAQAA